MAEAYGKLTGRPGVCLVTRGPGATHAVVGVHTAFQDSTPLILLVGQVASRPGGARGVPGDRLPAHVRARWRSGSAQIDDADAHPRVHRARIHDARGGPARARSCSRCRRTCSRGGRRRRAPRATGAVAAAPGADAVARLARAARRVRERPFVIARRRRLDPQARAGMARFAEANELPVGAAFRRQDMFDNDQPNYVGDVGIGINPKLAERVKDADLLLVVGARLGEMTTAGYTLLDIAGAAADAHPRPCGRGGARPRLPAGARRSSRRRAQFAAALERARAVETRLARRRPARARSTTTWRKPRPHARQGPDRRRIVRTARAPAADAIVTNGAGNFADWLHRFYRYTALPHAARADQRRDGLRRAGGGRGEARRTRRAPSSAFAGDGDFLMTGQELATAVQYGAPSSSWSSTTACTARSACTRSGIPGPCARGPS